MQVRVWQFLPTGPTAFGNSPYQSLSAFAGNELLIDVDWLVAEDLLAAHDVDPLADLPRHSVDYDRLLPAKCSILDCAAANFPSRGAYELRTAFEEFLHDTDEAWLHEYARFRVLKARHGQAGWQSWERPFRRRFVRSLAKLDRQAGHEIRRIKVLQFVFHRQWRELRMFARECGILLFGDMPIYVAADSADAWTRPDLLQMDRDGVMDAVAGVPPDYFSEDGQLWGNPLYRWKRHEKENFEWWVRRLRHAMSMSDLVRIDHFRGFESYWSVPGDAPTARPGHWIRGPGEALFRTLESRLGPLPIIAEDLGEITQAVTDLRQRFGIPGMQVLQFALADEDFHIDDIEEDCACYTGTHDNDTTIGWFRGKSTDERSDADIRKLRRRVLAITGGKPESIHRDLFRLALQSRARLAIAPMQDVLGLGSAGPPQHAGHQRRQLALADAGRLDHGADRRGNRQSRNGRQPCRTRNNLSSAKLGYTRAGRRTRTRRWQTKTTSTTNDISAD